MTPNSLEGWIDLLHQIHKKMEWCLVIRKQGINGIMIDKDDLAIEYQRLECLFLFTSGRILTYGESND